MPRLYNICSECPVKIKLRHTKCIACRNRKKVKPKKEVFDKAYIILVESIINQDVVGRGSKQLEYVDLEI